MFRLAFGLTFRTFLNIFPQNLQNRCELTFFQLGSENFVRLLTECKRNRSSQDNRNRGQCAREPRVPFPGGDLLMIGKSRAIILQVCFDTC